MQLRVLRQRSAQVLCAVVLGSLCGCESGTEFRCGTLAEQDVVTRCDRRHEVCVCATGGCAAADPGCESRLRYVDAPFSGEAAAKTCVATASAITAMDQHQSAAACESDALRDADASTGAAP
jgi:hypothetical protein